MELLGGAFPPFNIQRENVLFENCAFARYWIKLLSSVTSFVASRGHKQEERTGGTSLRWTFGCWGVGIKPGSKGSEEEAEWKHPQWCAVWYTAKGPDRPRVHSIILTPVFDLWLWPRASLTARLRGETSTVSPLSPPSHNNFWGTFAHSTSRLQMWKMFFGLRSCEILNKTCCQWRHVTSSWGHEVPFTSSTSDSTWTGLPSLPSLLLKPHSCSHGHANYRQVYKLPLLSEVWKVKINSCCKYNTGVWYYIAVAPVSTLYLMR